jgi:DNA-binding transcriptional ArsR family regulator
MAKQARIERWVWDSDSQTFAATGEAIDGDATSLEHLAEKLSAAGGRYLQGPIPWPWIVAAAALPGRALVVGLCLWRLAGATKSRTVVLGNSDLEPFGIDRATKSRALAVLEDAGLIAVARHPSRFPAVTLPASPASGRRGRRTSTASLATAAR